MREDIKNIEEKIVPYIEDVLNDSERRQVDAVLSKDPSLSREVAEIKQIVDELKIGFASGLQAPQERLSVEEVLELSDFQGKLDSMPGTSEQKARLFCSDEAFTEFQLLRALSEHSRSSQEPEVEAPPMPQALMDEFRAVQGADRAKVLPFVAKSSKLGFWKRAGNFLDRLDPKPLMASAAALVMLSLGVHMYSQPKDQSSSTAPVELAISEDGRATSPQAGGGEKADASVAAKRPGEPNGVTVFTSDDSSLLREQTEKLLAGKVRYSVSGDRILVAESDVSQARDLLWSDGIGDRVAVVEPESEVSKAAKSELRSDQESRVQDPKDTGDVPVASSDSDDRVAIVEEDSTPSEVVLHSTRSSSGDKASPRPTRPNPPAAPKRTEEIPSYRQSNGARSTSSRRVLKTNETRSPGQAKVANDYLNEKSSVNYGLPKKALEKESISDDRKQKLRDLALGRSKEGNSEAVSESTIPRSRVSAPSPETDEVIAPVAQAVTKEGYYGDSEPNVVANAVTRERLDRPELKDQSGVSGDDNGPVARQRVPYRPTTTQSSGSAGETQILTQQAPVRPPSVSAAAPPPTPTGAGASSLESSSRVLKVKERQSEVAKAHGVSLTVTPRGTSITVFVNAKPGLSEADKANLETKIRKDLGLLVSDTVVLRYFYSKRAF